MNPLQALRAWYIPILLRWHQSRVEKLSEAIRERDKGIAEDAMEITNKCGLINGQFFELRKFEEDK